MVRCLFVLAGVLFVASVTPGNSASAEKDWQLYTDHFYRLTLRFPQGWRKPTQIYADRPYFEGSDGHFQLNASEGHTPQQVCQGAATHHLQPFGSHPQIRSMKIQGQKACLVWPSEDQPDKGPHAQGEAELVVQYPQSIKSDGRYGQLILIADKNHILEIARTLRFLAST
jgi:TolB protein